MTHLLTANPDPWCNDDSFIFPNRREHHFAAQDAAIAQAVRQAAISCGETNPIEYLQAWPLNTRAQADRLGLIVTELSAIIAAQGGKT